MVIKIEWTRKTRRGNDWTFEHRGRNLSKRKNRKNVNQNKSKMKLHSKSLFERYMSLQFKINEAQNIYSKVLKFILN